MMTPYPGSNDVEDHLAYLRQRVARLEERLSHEIAERESLPKLVIPATAEIKQDLAELDKTFQLTRDAMDERLEQLRARVARGADGDAETIDEILRSMAERIGWLEQAYIRQGERQLRLLETQERLLDLEREARRLGIDPH